MTAAPTVTMLTRARASLASKETTVPPMSTNVPMSLARMALRATTPALIRMEWNRAPFAVPVWDHIMEICATPRQTSAHLLPAVPASTAAPARVQMKGTAASVSKDLRATIATAILTNAPQPRVSTMHHAPKGLARTPVAALQGTMARTATPQKTTASPRRADKLVRPVRQRKPPTRAHVPRASLATTVQIPTRAHRRRASMLAPVMGLLVVLCAHVPWVGTVRRAKQKRTSVTAIHAQTEAFVPTATTPTLVRVTLATQGITAKGSWIRARQTLANTVGHAAPEMMVPQRALVQQDTLVTCVVLTPMTASQRRARTAVTARTGWTIIRVLALKGTVAPTVSAVLQLRF